MKCHAGVEFANGKTCPKCKAGFGDVCWPGINEALLQSDRWRKRAAAAEAVLEFIVAGYASQDINHEDFRVHVYKAALETLEASPPSPADRVPPHD